MVKVFKFPASLEVDRFLYKMDLMELKNVVNVSVPY